VCVCVCMCVYVWGCVCMCVWDVCVCVCVLRVPHCNMWRALLYNIIAHYFTNDMIFGKKKSYWSHNVFWFLLQLLSETFFILMRSNRDMIKNAYRSSAPLFLYPILMKLEFSRQSFGKKKNTQISYFMKIRPVGAELFHSDSGTDMTKLIVAFRTFANAPK